jgi:large-conductance mechanosensitive channel
MEKVKSFLSAFKIGLKSFGEQIALLVNFLLLTVVYFFAIGPTSIIARLNNKKFIDLELRNKDKTYWKDEKNKEIKNYYQQF